MAQLRAFTMPKWGIEMSEGTVAEWMVQEGASFAKGDTITLIETDKITNEVEAEFDAVLARVIVQPGETVAVGGLVAVFATGDPASPAEIDAFVTAFRPADTRMAAAAPAPIAPPPAAGGGMNPSDESRAAPPAHTLPDELAISPAARRRAIDDRIDAAALEGSGRGGRITLQDVIRSAQPRNFQPAAGAVSIEPLGATVNVYASPLAKRLAALHGVDLAGLAGTGPRGRIGRKDVQQRIAQASPPAPEPAQAPEPAAAPLPSTPMDADGPFTVEAMSGVRKAIARQLSLSKQTIPHFYLRFSAQLDALNHMRAQAKLATGAAPSINDYLLRAVALALIEHPAVNVQVHGHDIHRFARANIAVAVETPKGLVTPVIRAAETKTVAAISAEVKGLAERARGGRLQADDMRGGGFSVSNLGMFGIENFDAIINPPQGAILAVGTAARRPIDANHAVAFATVAALSLSCDHRAIDGAVGARFCQTLKALIEEPSRLTA